MGGPVANEPAFRHLKANEPVLFASNSCLIVRRPGMGCGLCRDACPVGVLSGSQWSIALETDGCVGCGLCAAACPTGALMVEDCTPQPPSKTTDRIVLECRRVRGADLDPQAVVVPCLGGLTVPDLIDLVEATDATIIVADRGWCGSCSIGRCDAPWEAVVAEVKSMLAAVDPRLVDDLIVEQKTLSPDHAGPVLTALRPERQVGRRNFLLHLVEATQRETLAESRRVMQGRGLVEPRKRQRILNRLGSLAADLDKDMPAELMPAIKIAEGCELNGLCAAICPTGALRREEGEDSISLQFDADRCITCGECQRVCPSKALSLWPEGDGTVRRGWAAVMNRRTATCASCGDNFVAKADERACPACEKTTNVMREVATLRFGSPASDGRIKEQPKLDMELTQGGRR